jgi:HKD family nuclease
VAADGGVRLLTGLYQKFTEPQALRTLLRIQEETCGQLSVRLSLEPQFHRKMYLLTSRTRSTAILGSSNLTRDGLRSGGELNVMVCLPTEFSGHQEDNQGF